MTGDESKRLEWALGIAEVTMGAIGIFLALVALIIAVFAIFGYRFIRDWVRNTVEKMAKDAVDKLMTEEKIQEMLDKAATQAADSLYADMEKSPGHFTDGIDKKEKT